MIVGCYSLDLYCAGSFNVPRAQRPADCLEDAQGFTGRNRTQATREAREAGWKVQHAREGKPGQAWCPNCKGRK